MNKPVLYLLAGNGGAADWWEDFLPHLQQYRGVPIELPGFGDNPKSPCASLDEYVEALLAATETGQPILAVGINALLVMHALRRKPGHFSRSILLAPVGAFLWRRRLPALMRWRLLQGTVHWLLAHKPRYFAKAFSQRQWSSAQYERMGRGYARCRAFKPYWDIFRPDNALALLEWVVDPIDIVWGTQDAVLGAEQATAWAAILARADLHVDVHPDWGHYPWIDEPARFAAWLESGHRGFVAHGKGGRLQLATLAGLPVPRALTLQDEDDARLPALLAAQANELWAVRSSSLNEDQADHANAGLSQTFLRVPAAEVPNRVRTLRESGVEHVVVQRFVQPVLSGIAFIRKLSVEIEWVSGHLESLADGRATPQRAVLSHLGDDWYEGGFPKTNGLDQSMLRQFLNRVLHTFHYVHGDVEWAWDGSQLHLLQYRPISNYPWRRHLTAANIGEILPQKPSRLIDHALDRIASSVPAVMARWDTRVLEDNEPFTTRHGGALYINNDYMLSRLRDWGLPFTHYGNEIGGGTPTSAWHVGRLLMSLPLLWRMQRHSRKQMDTLELDLRRFDVELRALSADSANANTLIEWLLRFQLYVVQSNICIATALAGSGGTWLGKPPTAYSDIANTPHRLPWETDPATPRPPLIELPLQALPEWPCLARLAHKLGLPGMRGYYLQVREWFRDNHTRIYFRLHHAMPVSERDYWFAPVEHERCQRDSFWQDGHDGNHVRNGFVIYPGSATGILGKDVLLVDSLDPGRHAEYREAQAVIARMGGRLSHGSTLLRELRKPSAVLPSVDPAWNGRRVNYRNGVLSLVTTEMTS